MPNSLPQYSRRSFLTQTGGTLLAATSLNSVFAQEAEADTFSLRAIAYNVLKCNGWPSDRRLPTTARTIGQMPDRYANALALYSPDIITLSESPKESVTKEIAKHLKMNIVHFPSGEYWPGTLLTRYEIQSSKNVPLVSGERPKDLFTRHWGRAVIKLPNGESLIVHSAHLHPSDATIRTREIKMMLESMESDFKEGRSMLLMGDMNLTPTKPEYKLFLDAGWKDTFAEVGKGEGLTYPSSTPDRRIDYILATGPIAKQIKASKPLYEGAFRLNLADRQSFALSDHVPQLAEFEIGK